MKLTELIYGLGNLYLEIGRDVEVKHSDCEFGRCPAVVEFDEDHNEVVIYGD